LVCERCPLSEEDEFGTRPGCEGDMPCRFDPRYFKYAPGMKRTSEDRALLGRM